jgi:hypothetical protein
LLAQYAENWPGILFWSRSGAAAFASLQNDEAIDLYQKLRQNFSFGLNAVDSILRGYRPRARAKQILHLSDLHFGTDTARANIDYLREYLREKAKTITRAVITGDLIDSPGGLDDPAFVQRWLTREIGADVLLVPGNHDQRWRGNRMLTFGDDKTSLADLVLFKVVPDSDLRCVFLGFDSSRGGNLAMGKVTESQMSDRRQEFDTQCSVNPDIQNYMRIAVLHHHPFQFVAWNETIVQRVLAMVGMDEERVLALEDRERFIRWCQINEIPIVLHGHMHKARFRPGCQPGEPTAIGCGTSLGAEGLPLSFNVLTIDPGSHSVSVSLFSDNGNKSGFQAQMTSIVQA